MYDVIIIGSGPAGLSAAIYAKRAALDTLVIEKSPLSGGQILNTYEVDNYPGLHKIICMELGKKMRAAGFFCDRISKGNHIRGRCEEGRYK